MRFLRRGVIYSGFAWKSLLWRHGKEGGETGGWKITWKDPAFIQCYELGIISGCFPKICVDVHGVREGLTLWRVRRKEKNHIMKPCLYLHKDITSIEKIFTPHLPASAALLCSSRQFSLVTQPCLILWDPLACSTPGFPLHHQLPELAQTHVQKMFKMVHYFHCVVFLSINCNSFYCLFLMSLWRTL